MSEFTWGLFIPTYKAEPYLTKLLPAIAGQSVQPNRFLVIDSSSNDRTADLCREAGAEVVVIDQSEFNHGGTRQRGAEALSDMDVVVFLTHDALPANTHCFENILKAFVDEGVGMAYGRQLPRDGASPIEIHARVLNYPDLPERRTRADASRLGAKVAFCSNAFAAYRITALAGVEYFPSEVIVSEDTYCAGKMLLAGWSMAYQADAQVKHSHDYTITEEFKRYFDIGAFHSEQPWLIESFGRIEGEGLKFVQSELKFLLARAPLHIPSALIRTLTKLIGFKLGQRQEQLSKNTKRRLSMHAFYWD
jgi:glycosyltransferase involved in cell wall biosynthesis